MCIQKFSDSLFPEEQGKLCSKVKNIGTAEIDIRLLVVSCSVISNDSDTGMANHTCLASTE